MRIDAALDDLPLISLDPAAEQIAAAPFNPEEILKLPQSPARDWQAGDQPMPAWITGEGQPYRPWMAMVVNRTDELILAHAAFPGDSIGRLALGPHEFCKPCGSRRSAGCASSAGRRRGGLAGQAAALHSRHLNQVNVECGELEQLELVETMVDDMARHFGGPTNSPSLLDVPGMGSTLGPEVSLCRGHRFLLPPQCLAAASARRCGDSNRLR